ncbi:MAG TPA: DUF2277 domain-containing protein [Bryobacteraceae bacterium]|jgi:hypothetical protein|nr:DUF2277 domain-containing protein [Bryobacteraceae bacterium]
MCRSIKKLRNPEQPATAEELHNAALQFVRKISGFHKPSLANREAFDRAVLEISGSSERLLAALGSGVASTRG